MSYRNLDDKYFELLKYQMGAVSGIPWSDGGITSNIPLDESHSRYHTIDIIKREFDGVNIPGDIVEVGCGMGGMGVYMAKRFPNKKVYLLDSFKGIEPKETRPYQYEDTTHLGGEFKVDQSYVENLIKDFGLSSQVTIVPGWIKDTFPTLSVEKIAILRIDVDTYSGVRESLDALYDKVVIGGAIIIDDSTISETRAGLIDWLLDKNLYTSKTEFIRIPLIKIRSAYGDCPVIPFTDYNPERDWGIWWRKE